jgi:uncharacterized membrane protein
MSDIPVQVVIAAFASEHGAADALHDLRDAQEDGLIRIRDAAVIHRNKDGQLNVEDTARHGIGRGAVIGGVAGAIVGLLTGPVGWAAGGGAVIGALASRLSQSGFREDALHQISESLRPETSVLVAVVEQTWLDEVVHLVTDKAKHLVTAAIQADIATQLEAGRDVAYTAQRPT